MRVPAAHQGSRTIDPSRQPPPTIKAGGPYPLGATHDGGGTNFSVFSRVAERVELCLFDEAGREERVVLPEMTGHAWHGYLPGVGPGQRYGFRVHGPWDPAFGRRCNPRKLLLDPYARAIDGRIDWGPAHLRARPGRPVTAQRRGQRAVRAPLGHRRATRSTGRTTGAPACPITTRSSTRSTSRASRCDTRGCRPASAAPMHGLAHPAAIEHLRSLGVTSVELLPTHQFLHDGFLLERGLRNYWGYNSIGYFAPHAEYAAGGSARGPGRRVQGHGPGPPRGRPGGHPRRRLQPHRRGGPRRPHAVVAGPRQPGLLPAPARTIRAATSTTPAPATR